MRQAKTQALLLRSREEKVAALTNSNPKKKAALIAQSGLL
jgi:hypothetical protein